MECSIYHLPNKCKIFQSKRIITAVFLSALLEQKRRGRRVIQQLEKQIQVNIWQFLNNFHQLSLSFRGFVCLFLIPVFNRTIFTSNNQNMPCFLKASKQGNHNLNWNYSPDWQWVQKIPEENIIYSKKPWKSPPHTTIQSFLSFLLE